MQCTSTKVEQRGTEACETRNDLTQTGGKSAFMSAYTGLRAGVGRLKNTSPHAVSFTPSSVHLPSSSSFLCSLAGLPMLDPCGQSAPTKNRLHLHHLTQQIESKSTRLAHAS